MHYGEAFQSYGPVGTVSYVEFTNNDVHDIPHHVFPGGNHVLVQGNTFRRIFGSDRTGKGMTGYALNFSCYENENHHWIEMQNVDVLNNSIFSTRGPGIYLGGGSTEASTTHLDYINIQGNSVYMASDASLGASTYQPYAVYSDSATVDTLTNFTFGGNNIYNSAQTRAGEVIYFLGAAYTVRGFNDISASDGISGNLVQEQMPLKLGRTPIQ